MEHDRIVVRDVFIPDYPEFVYIPGSDTEEDI